MHLRLLSTLLLLTVFSVAAETPPPVPWGIPLEGGPLRVLFIAPAYTLTDAHELGQRLELDYQTAAIQDRNHLGPEKMQAELHERLAETYQVIVMGNFDFSILPEDALSVLVSKVQEGTGLVLARYGEEMGEPLQGLLDNLEPVDSSDIIRGIGESLTPEWPSSLDFVQAGQFGKGRVVQLDFGSVHPFSHFVIPALSHAMEARPEFFETYLSLVGKAVRWASGHDDGLFVRTIEDISPKGPDDDEIPPDLPEEYIQQLKDSVARPSYQKLLVRLNAPAPQNYTVKIQVREPYRERRVEYPDVPPLKKGRDTYLIEAPIGPGRYFLDLWFLDNQKVVGWHTEPITVENWPQIDKVVFSKAFLLPNDSMTVSLNVRPQLSRPRPCKIYTRGIDSLGRVVSEASGVISAEGGSILLPLRFSDLLANQVKLEVFAIDASAPVAATPVFDRPTRWELEQASYTCQYVPVRILRNASQLQVGIYGEALAEYNVRQQLEALKRLGVDSVYAPISELSRFYSSSLNLRLIPELTDFAPEDEDGGLRQPCLNDPAYQLTQAAHIREGEDEAWRAGASTVFLGRGNRLADSHDVCLCEACVQAFRQMLQLQYKEIDQLNAAWQTQFESFDDVCPLTREQALQSNVIAPWLDFRLYMDTVLTNTHVIARDVVRATEPDARVGFVPEPGRAPFLGYDWYNLASQLDALAIGPDALTVEKVRSYAQSEAYTALAIDSTALANDPAWAQWLPWYQVLHNIRGLWISPAYGGAESLSSVPVMDASRQPSDAMQTVSGMVTELKSGIGSLLLGATRAPADIAIYDSQTSEYLAHFKGFEGSGLGEGQEAWGHLLEEMGYQYDFVKAANLKRATPYKLVVLPSVYALSDAEISALQEFCANGGALVADVLPGQFDQHGNERAHLPLKDLFVSVQEADGKRAVLLGEPIVKVELDESQEKTTHDALCTFFGSLAIMPAIQNSGGQPFDGERAAFTYGTARIAALLRNPGGEPKRQKVAVAFDKHTTVYDVRTGKKLRNAKKVEVALGPGEVSILSALPYEVSSIELTAPEFVAPGQRLALHVQLKTKGDLPGTHLVQITLSRMDKLLEHYILELICKNGEASSYIPLARNEVPGVYTLTAKDVLSGVLTQARVTVADLAEVP